MDSKSLSIRQRNAISDIVTTWIWPALVETYCGNVKVILIKLLHSTKGGCVDGYKEM
jgi:hypothetical protein